MNFAKFLKATFLQNTSERLLLTIKKTLVYLIFYNVFTTLKYFKTWKISTVDMGQLQKDRQARPQVTTSDYKPDYD